MSTLAIRNNRKVQDCIISLRGRKYFEVRNNRVKVERVAAEIFGRRFIRTGICIPAPHQSEFGDRQFIRKDDPQFAKALVRVFFKEVLVKMGFIIEKSEALAKKLSKLDIQTS